MSRRRLAVLATIMVFLLGVMLVGLVPFKQILNQRDAVAAAEDRLSQLQEENERLTGQVQALETPIEIERRAREDFGLVRPGETAYIVMPVDPPGEPTETSESTSPGFFRSIVEFFTGADENE